MEIRIPSRADFESLWGRIPGPAAVLVWLGVGQEIFRVLSWLLDWKARIEEAVRTAHQVGVFAGVLFQVAVSPWFGLSLVLIAVGYIIFVPSEQQLRPSLKVAGLVAWIACILAGLTLWSVLVVAIGVMPDRTLAGRDRHRFIAALHEVHDPIAVHVTWAPNHSEAFNYASNIYSAIVQTKNPKIKPDLIEAAGAVRTSIIGRTRTYVVQPPAEFWLEFTGVTLFVPDVSRKSTGATQFSEALDAARIKYQWSTDRRLGKTSDGVDECTLLIGLRRRE